MKKIILLLTVLYAGNVSAAVNFSEGRPDANEIPLAPTAWGQSAPVQSQFSNLPGLYATTPGQELIQRHTRSTTVVGANQTYTHSFGIYNSNTGAPIRVMPTMSLTAPAADLINWTIGFLTIGTGVAAKLYSVESIYSEGLVQRNMKVQVDLHPATGAVIKKFTLTFPANNAYGAIDHGGCFVKDINGDGREEIAVKYYKMVGVQRIRTFVIHNVETGAFIRNLVVTTPN